MLVGWLLLRVVGWLVVVAQIVTSAAEEAYLVASLVFEGLSMCTYCTIFIYVSIHWATVLISNKSQKAVKSLWRTFVGLNILLYVLIMFLCGESAQVITCLLYTSDAADE